MSEQDWTKEPWAAAKEPRRDGEFSIRGPSNQRLALAYTEADALLIAAAPTLLKALQALLCDCSSGSSYGCYLHDANVRQLAAEYFAEQHKVDRRVAAFEAIATALSEALP
mgnify:CR=1 FL=1